MKLFRLLPLLTIMCMFSSCNTEAPTTTEPTRLTFTVSDVMGTQALVSVAPEDIRAYYYYDVVPAEQILNSGRHDDRIMLLIMDSVKRHYLDWRYNYLLEDETYIADFKSHCLHYGADWVYFVQLQPETDYLVIGFCVNPITEEPLGELQRYAFRTTAVDDSTVSKTRFDFQVNMYENPTQEDVYSARISVRPSLNGHPSLEPYIWSYVEDDYLDEMYGGDIYQFVAEYVRVLTQYGDIYRVLSSDIQSMEYDGFTPGKSYTLIAAAYRLTWPQALYTRRFTYEVGKELKYDHDTPN